MSTLSASAIFINVCKSGWCMLVHHLLTVTAETPNCSANHLLVFWFSTSTTFSQLRGFSLDFIRPFLAMPELMRASLWSSVLSKTFIFIKLNLDAKIINFSDMTKFSFNNLLINAFLNSSLPLLPFRCHLRATLVWNSKKGAANPWQPRFTLKK